MIYTKDFVWLHFPKCAGTKVERLFVRHFSKQPGLFQDPVGIEKDPSIAWHDTIAEREARDPTFTLGTRTIICSFRRLPSWLESRYNFEIRRNPQLAHRPELLLEGKFLEEDGSVNHADGYARKYLPEKILNSGTVRFLRTEFFEADFMSIFGEFLDISRIADRRFKKRVNTSRKTLLASVRHRLYNDLAKVYSHCPYWRSVEELAYGIPAVQVDVPPPDALCLAVRVS